MTENNNRFLNSTCALNKPHEQMKDVPCHRRVLELIFEAMPEALIYTDKDRRIALVNRRFTRVFGYEPEEVMGQGSEILYSRHEKWKDLGTERAEIADDEPYRPFDIELRRKNGEVFLSEMVSAPVRDPQGGVIGCLKLVRDITDHKKALDALTENEGMLCEAEEIAGLGSHVWDLRTDALRLSKNMIQITGLNAENIPGTLGTVVQQYVHPEDREWVQSQIDAMLSERKTWPLEFRIQRPDGEARMIRTRTRFLFDEEGLPILNLGVHYDITEQKKMESALVDLAIERTTILENQPDLMVLQGLDHRILWTNRDSIEVQGEIWTRNELIGSFCYEVWGHRVKPCPECPVDLALRTGLPQTKIKQSRDGRTWRLRSCPIRNGEQEITHMLKVIEDTTENVRAEEERAHLEAQLRQAQKMEAIGTLAGGIAHDFNNILYAILGNAELALSMLPDDNPARHRLEEIQKSGYRARDLVKQILSFSRRTRTVRKPIRCLPVIQETIKLLEAALPSSLELNLEVNGLSDLILADSTEIHQVVINLCTNAVQAMDKCDGSIIVSIDNILAEGESDELHPRGKPTHLRFSVRDSGWGIPKEIIDRIFDPFFTTKPVGSGTGLGLSVVQRIVKELGGEISVESRIAVGTTITVSLPLVDESQAPREEEPKKIPRGMGSVLIVEDEEILAEMLAMKLKTLGYETVFHLSSLDALEDFKHRPYAFDLVLTDQTMPRLTGDKLAAELLKIRPELPILLCTGYHEELTMEKARRLGIKELLMKPIDHEALAEVLSRHLTPQW